MYKLTRKMYEEDTYKSKWLLNIHNTLNKCGLSNVWIQGQQLSGKWIVENVKSKLKDICKQTLLENLNTGVKCLNYRIIKENTDCEKYLTTLNPVNRINLCKFRCANAKIPVHIT